ncbi:hypothetical protein ABZZ74_52530 [Streptomyces sp. NPDC006476]|uniref:hypothetical protein n=1 Tax=Streptomyces sp. NPDC006476 TaxID=3157175 RepID=UPI0033B8AE7B
MESKQIRDVSDQSTGLNVESLLHLLTAVNSLPQYGVGEHLRAGAEALLGRPVEVRDSPAFRRALSSLNQGPFDERFKFRIACLVRWCSSDRFC